MRRTLVSRTKRCVQLRSTLAATALASSRGACKKTSCNVKMRALELVSIKQSSTRYCGFCQKSVRGQGGIGGRAGSIDEGRARAAVEVQGRKRRWLATQIR